MGVYRDLKVILVFEQKLLKKNVSQNFKSLGCPCRIIFWYKEKLFSKFDVNKYVISWMKRILKKTIIFFV